MKCTIKKFVLFALSVLITLMVIGMTGCAGSAKNQALDHVNQGYALASQGKYDEAIAEYNIAIELDPNNALAYNYRGEAYKGKGEYDQALADFDKAIELDPEDQRAYANRVMVEQMIAMAKLQNRLNTTTGEDTSATGEDNSGSETVTPVDTGEWPTFSDENRIVIYQQMITGNINDDNGNLTYHVNPTILRACGGKPNDESESPYTWSSPDNLVALGIDLDDSGLVTGLEDFGLEEGTRTFTVEVTDGKLTAKGTVTLVVTRYDVSSKDGIPGVPGPWAVLQQWPQEVVDKYPLPDAKAGHHYGVTLPILGGTPPYDFSQDNSYVEGEGAGASVDSGLYCKYGIIYGIIPTSLAGEIFRFDIIVKDSDGETDPYSPVYAIKVLP